MGCQRGSGGDEAAGLPAAVAEGAVSPEDEGAGCREAVVGAKFGGEGGKDLGEAGEVAGLVDEACEMAGVEEGVVALGPCGGGVGLMLGPSNEDTSPPFGSSDRGPRAAAGFRESVAPGVCDCGSAGLDRTNRSVRGIRRLTHPLPTPVGTVSVGEPPLGIVDLYGPTTPLKAEELQRSSLGRLQRSRP